jgi:hypothetical protein
MKKLFGKSEINEFDAWVYGFAFEQNVFRLQVSVTYIPLMQITNTGDQLTSNQCRLDLRKSAILYNPTVQLSSLTKLSDNMEMRFVFIDFIEVHNIRVIDSVQYWKLLF